MVYRAFNKFIFQKLAKTNKNLESKIFSVSQFKQNEKLHKSHFFFVENICFGADWDATKYNKLSPVGEFDLNYPINAINKADKS